MDVRELTSAAAGVKSVRLDLDDFHTVVGIISEIKQTFCHFCGCLSSTGRLYETSGSAVKVWVDSAKAAEHTLVTHQFISEQNTLAFIRKGLLFYVKYAAVLPAEHPGAELTPKHT